MGYPIKNLMYIPTICLPQILFIPQINSSMIPVLTSNWSGSVTRTNWIKPTIGTEQGNTGHRTRRTNDNVRYKKRRRWKNGDNEEPSNPNGQPP